METNDITFEERGELIGTKCAKILRKNDMIPATLYGEGIENTMHLALHKNSFPKKTVTYGSIMSQQIKITNDSKSFFVLVKKVDIHPVNHEVLHMDLQNIGETKDLKVNVALYYINSTISDGVKAGGVLYVFYKSIKLLCMPNKLIRELNIDTLSIKIGQKIIAKDLELPEGVRLAIKDHVVLAKIVGSANKGK